MTKKEIVVENKYITRNENILRKKQLDIIKNRISSNIKKTNIEKMGM